jgi:xylulose-5-phosphate/fructose-6-phosphate phosphoketolase
VRGRVRRSGDRSAGDFLAISKFLSPIRDGAVLPILHLNGYKINNPTLLARASHEEIDSLFRGYGWTPYK